MTDTLTPVETETGVKTVTGANALTEASTVTEIKVVGSMTAAERMAARTETVELHVLALELIADRVLSVTLGAAPGAHEGNDHHAELPVWSPGAHIDLHLPGGLTRQYSLCSDPADRGRWRIAVLLEPDGLGGSVIVHEQLRVGDKLTSSRPVNTFGYQRCASVIFVAAGIGITPLLPMIHAAERNGADWRLLYLGRSAEAMCFRDELGQFGARVLMHDTARYGRLSLTKAVSKLLNEMPDDATTGPAQLYACGPERMLSELESGCQENGRSLRVERFVAADAVDVGSRAAGERTNQSANQPANEPFIVETSDGTEIEVGADESILAAMMRCGIPALNSCQEGICGTCETVVIGGEPEHRDQVLSEEERQSNETMMICVSRCVGKRLVLDL